MSVAYDYYFVAYFGGVKTYQECANISLQKSI